MDLQSLSLLARGACTAQPSAHATRLAVLARGADAWDRHATLRLHLIQAHDLAHLVHAHAARQVLQQRISQPQQHNARDGHQT